MCYVFVGAVFVTNISVPLVVINTWRKQQKSITLWKSLASSSKKMASEIFLSLLTAIIIFKCIWARYVHIQPPQICFGRINTRILRLKSNTDIARQSSSEIVVNRLQQSLPEYHSQTMSSALHQGLSMITTEHLVKSL